MAMPYAPTAAPRPKRRWKRRLWRGGLAVLGLTLLGAAVAVFGWRYGFTPLPEPVAGWTYRPPARIPLAELPRDNAWYWLVQLGQLEVVGSPAQQRLGEAAQIWSSCGGSVLTNRAEINDWLDRHQLIHGFRELALACTNRQLPELDAALSRGRALASQYSLWRAAEAERATNAPLALRELINVWRLRYSWLWSKDHDWRAAMAWRRIALTGPPISRADAGRLFAELDAAMNALPTFEEAYRTANAIENEEEWFNALFKYEEDSSPGWDSMEDEFRDALHGMLRDARELPERLVEAFRADSLGSLSEHRGMLRLLAPVSSVLRLAAMKVTRKEDLRRSFAAVHGQILSRAERGELEAALTWEAELYAQLRNRWAMFRLFDRPVVWSALDAHYHASLVDQPLRKARTALELCRLALAFRLFRDEHGRWPEQLEELTPGILTALPPDPFSGQPFHYRREGDRWFLSCSRDQTVDTGSLAQGHRQLHWSDRGDSLVYASDEFELRLTSYHRELAWRTNNPPQPMMDIRMLMRYGLLPKGYQLVPNAP